MISSFCFRGFFHSRTKAGELCCFYTTLCTGISPRPLSVVAAVACELAVVACELAVVACELAACLLVPAAKVEAARVLCLSAQPI